MTKGKGVREDGKRKEAEKEGSKEGRKEGENRGEEAGSKDRRQEAKHTLQSYIAGI